LQTEEQLLLFINEENGIAGAKAYALAHAREVGKHVAMSECDIGAGAPLSFTLHSGPGGAALLRPRLQALETLGCSAIAEADHGGADLSPLQKLPDPPPVLELVQDTTHYFDWHHSAADTLDKVDPRALAEACAAFTFAIWTLADMPETLPRPGSAKEEK